MTKKKIRRLVKAEQPDVRIKELDRLVERQSRMIEKLRRARVPLVSPSRRKKKKGGFVRVLCSDSHGAIASQDAINAFLADLEVLQPAEIVHLGDALDCGGFLSSHKTLGVVPELAITFEEDVMAANAFLDGMQKAAPDAKLSLLAGNHEARIHRFVCDQVLSNHANAEYLLKLFGPDAVLNLKQRGVRYIERHEYYDGLSITGTIRLGSNVIAQHGEGVSGPNAVFRKLTRMGSSIFFGHTHRLTVAYAEKVDESLVAVNTGCLCDRRPVYGLTNTTDWTHGYAIQFVQPDEGFLAFTVPILNGVSYLSPLLRMIG